MNMSGFVCIGNVVFDEYCECELKCFEEEKVKLDVMCVDFDDFMRELCWVCDQEEFECFMVKWN